MQDEHRGHTDAGPGAAFRGASVWPWDPLPESVGVLLHMGLPGAAGDMIDAIRSEVPE